MYDLSFSVSFKKATDDDLVIEGEEMMPNFEFFFTDFFWQILEVQLLDKRGYLTICLSLAAKDGKLFLRKPEGIREWYHTLKVIRSP